MLKNTFKVSNTTFFVCLLSLVALASASGQAPPRKLSVTEPLEKYDNPPAPPRRMETSPRMISQHGPFNSFQANVDANGNNIVGDAANEPSISVDPTNTNKMVIAWRQFNDVTSNFRQAGWGYHQRWWYDVDISRCSGKQHFSQRPGFELR